MSWKVAGPGNAADLQFGVMLFPTNDLKDLEQRSRQNDLPAIRPATALHPGAARRSCGPGTTWRGTISAPGALAGGLWARISFGPFVSDGDPPPGVDSPLGWITDHAYHLAVVAAQPA